MGRRVLYIGRTLARDQRALKFFIRLMLPACTLGGFGAVWGLVMVGLNQQRIVNAVWSPDGHYRASVVRYSGAGGCGPTSSSLVVLERRNFLVKTGEFTPFCLDGSPDRITLAWDGERKLTIGCSGCEENYGFADENWGKLHFSYDLDQR